MIDNFALLEEPRRPWLDVEALKEKFIALSARVHPDRVHNSPTAEREAAGQTYAEINTAYNCLRETKERLRHLLELELGAKPEGIQRVPQQMMDSLFEVGSLCQKVDAFLVEKAKVTSPILQVQWFERGHDWMEKLNELQQKITARREALLAELQTMNPAWESAERATGETRLPLERLEEIYRLLGYLGRWSAQIQERVVQLTL